MDATTTDSAPREILADEELLSRRDAAAQILPVSGRRPTPGTLWRWCRRGLYGVRPEHVRIGGALATSREAFERFFAALPPDAEADRTGGLR